MSVDDETTVVDKTIVVDALEYIRVDIAVTAGDKHASLQLELVLLSALLLFLLVFFSLGFLLLAEVLLVLLFDIAS